MSTPLLIIDGLLVAATFAAWICAKHLRGIALQADREKALRIVRSIRAGTAALGLVLIAAGIYLEQKWLSIFGSVFLFAEYYETSTMLAVLKSETPDPEPIPGHNPGPRENRAP